jgi:hypothetical protein
VQVGDYVRTKDYGFIKVKSFYYNEDLMHILDENNNEYDFSKELVNNFKSSPNIIDLIEVGDYVNGLRVEENKYGELYTSYVYYGGDIGKQCEVYTIWLEEYKENEDYIDSILTKEQFENMEFKVNGNNEF